MKFSQDYVHNCFVFLDAMLRWPLFTARSAHCTVSPDLDTLPGQVRTPLTQPRLTSSPGGWPGHWTLHIVCTQGDYILYIYLFSFVKANEMKNGELDTILAFY